MHASLAGPSTLVYYFGLAFRLSVYMKIVLILWIGLIFYLAIRLFILAITTIESLFHLVGYSQDFLHIFVFEVTRVDSSPQFYQLLRLLLIFTTL